jgi:hypothetical protein
MDEMVLRINRSKQAHHPCVEYNNRTLVVAIDTAAEVLKTLPAKSV